MLTPRMAPLSRPRMASALSSSAQEPQYLGFQGQTRHCRLQVGASTPIRRLVALRHSASPHAFNYSLPATVDKHVPSPAAPTWFSSRVPQVQFLGRGTKISLHSTRALQVSSLSSQGSARAPAGHPATLTTELVLEQGLGCTRGGKKGLRGVWM